MRPWDDMRQYGFITAGGGKWYTDGLARLSIGDQVFYYQPNNGYLGYGVVTTEPGIYGVRRACLPECSIQNFAGSPTRPIDQYYSAKILGRSQPKLVI